MHYLVDSLETVANRLYHFLSLPAHHEKIRSAIKLVKTNYEAGVVAQTRHRGSALQALLESVGTEHFFETVVAFFQDKEGGWKTTSANTNLVYQFLRMLPDFSLAYDDDFFNPAHSGLSSYTSFFNFHHIRLSELLIQRYQNIKNNVVTPVLSHDAMFEGRVKERQMELAEIKSSPKGSIKARQKAMFASAIFTKKNTLPEPKKLGDNNNFAEAMNAVQSLFLNKKALASALETDIAAPKEDLTKATLFDDKSALTRGVLVARPSLVGLFGGACRAMPPMIAASRECHEREIFSLLSP